MILPSSSSKLPSTIKTPWVDTTRGIDAPPPLFVPKPVVPSLRPVSVLRYASHRDECALEYCLAFDQGFVLLSAPVSDMSACHLPPMGLFQCHRIFCKDIAAS